MDGARNDRLDPRVVLDVMADLPARLPTEPVSRDELLIELYARHYGSLVRLAALLLDDVGGCEDVVQEAFVRLHAGWARLREQDKALAYLRRSVLNLARSRPRHRRVVERYVAPRPPDMISAEDAACAAVERAAVVRALRTLPRRQREAVVLRYYAELSQQQAAEAMGVSVGAVKAYLSRGLDRLTERLEELR